MDGYEPDASFGEDVAESYDVVRGCRLRLGESASTASTSRRRANPFFATVVRSQSKRGHRVIERGPYAWVRHPGHAGAILAQLVLPLSLGTLWGLAPALLGCLLLAARIVREERTLRGGLAGYSEYGSRVRWRLVPGVW